MDDRRDNKVINLKKVTAENDFQKNSKAPLGDFKPNEDLLQSTARIKQQRDIIRERIGLMESSSSRVTKSVFEKVFRDYTLQLQTITEILNEKKESLKKEIKELYVRREKLSVEINRHKEILEEAEFRHFLGEFSQSQFQEVENYETKEIEKLENDLTQISSFIRSHEDLFDPYDLGRTPNTQKAAEEVTKTVAKETKEVVTKQVSTQTTEQSLQENAVQPTQQTQVQTHQSEQAQDITIDPNDTNEFENLFLDDDESEEKQRQLAESQSNIQNILSGFEEPFALEEESSDLFPKPDEASDYFQQEKVEESSITVKKKLESSDDLSSDDLTPLPQDSKNFLEDSITKPTKQAAAQSEIKTDVNLQSNAGFRGDDSISEILSSIDLENAPEEVKAAQQAPQIETSSTAPTAEGAAKLTLIEGELDQKEFPLKENTSIGRSPSNDITLKAPKVSRQHAAINMYNNQFILIDLKSSNGVFVNGAKIDECVLNPGDEVSVGGYKFIFSVS